MTVVSPITCDMTDSDLFANRSSLLDSVTPSDDISLVRVNVSGTRFEILKSTLQSDTNVCSKFVTEGVWSDQMQEWYFERDPVVFRFVHLYLRTKEVHLPQNICGPILEREMNSWGVYLRFRGLQRCCFAEVMHSVVRTKSLNTFEGFYRRRHHYLRCETSADSLKSKVFATMWQFLNDPRTSWISTVYAISICLTTAAAIFLFAAGTHESFRRHLTQREIQAIMNDEPANSTMAKRNHLGNVTVEKEWLIEADIFVFSIFVADFLLRLIFCPSLSHFASSLYTAIDLLSLFPFVFEITYTFIWKHSRLSLATQIRLVDYVSFVKVFLLLRFFRMLRHNRGTRVLLHTIRVSLVDLVIMLVIFFLCNCTFGTLVYFIEDDFASISVGIWWSAITMTTVGYGDMVPRTLGGYLVGGCAAVCGILIIALTVPVMVNHFNLFYSHSAMLDEMDNTTNDGFPRGAVGSSAS